MVVMMMPTVARSSGDSSSMALKHWTLRNCRMGSGMLGQLRRIEFLSSSPLSTRWLT